MKPFFLFIPINWSCIRSLLRSIVLGWGRRENKHAGQHLGAQPKGTKQNPGGLSLSCHANTDQPARVHSFHFIETLPWSLFPFSSFLSSLFLSPHLPRKTLQKRWEIAKWFRSSQFLLSSSNVPIVSSRFDSTADFKGFPDVECTFQFRGNLELPTSLPPLAKLLPEI